MIAHSPAYSPAPPTSANSGGGNERHDPVTFMAPYGIDPQDVPWLADLVAKQAVLLLDVRQLHDLSLSVSVGPHCALHTARLSASVNDSVASPELIAIKQHHRPSDLIFEIHQLLITPPSQYTNPLIGIVQLGDQGLTCLVVPFHPLGNLRQYIADQGTNLTALHQLQIVYDIASALESFHHRNALHLNLHSANVLITLQGLAVLTDFGRVNTRAEVGMPPKPRPEQERARSLATVFMAPEVLASSSYTTRSEIYALGMIMFELLTGHVAFEKDLSLPGLSTRIMFGRQDTILLNLPNSPGPVYEALIRECWRLNPSERPHLSHLKSRLEALMGECSTNEAMKQQQELENLLQAQMQLPQTPLSPPVSRNSTSCSVAPGTPTISSHPHPNIVTTQIIVPTPVRQGSMDRAPTTSTTLKNDGPTTENDKPVEAWTIGSAASPATTPARKAIPITSRALELSSSTRATKPLLSSQSITLPLVTSYSPVPGSASPLSTTPTSTGAPMTPPLKSSNPSPYLPQQSLPTAASTPSHSPSFTAGSSPSSSSHASPTGPEPITSTSASNLSSAPAPALTTLERFMASPSTSSPTSSLDKFCPTPNMPNGGTPSIFAANAAWPLPPSHAFRASVDMDFIIGAYGSTYSPAPSPAFSFSAYTGTAYSSPAFGAIASPSPMPMIVPRPPPVTVPPRGTSQALTGATLARATTPGLVAKSVDVVTPTYLASPNIAAAAAAVAAETLANFNGNASTSASTTVTTPPVSTVVRPGEKTLFCGEVEERFNQQQQLLKQQMTAAPLFSWLQSPTRPSPNQSPKTQSLMPSPIQASGIAFSAGSSPEPSYARAKSMDLNRNELSRSSSGTILQIAGPKAEATSDNEEDDQASEVATQFSQQQQLTTMGSGNDPRESLLMIPVFPEPPVTLHNRRISNMDARFRTAARQQHTRTVLREANRRTDSVSSDDSLPKAPANPTRVSIGSAQPPQDAPNGSTNASSGLIGRGSYNPITSSDHVPLPTPSDNLYSAARNGDLDILQDFLLSALRRPPSDSPGIQSRTVAGRGRHSAAMAAAEILDQAEPVEKLPVLCCAAVARKNKYLALNLVAKAGASVDGKELRGGNTSLHLVCETAPPPLMDPSVKSRDNVMTDETTMSLNGNAAQHQPRPSIERVPEKEFYRFCELNSSEASQEEALRMVDMFDELEQEALDRVRHDSEALISTRISNDGMLVGLTMHLETQDHSDAHSKQWDQILIKGGLEDQIRLLVLLGSPIDVPNYRGETALLLLLRYHDNVSAFATLLRLGADPTHMAPFGPGMNTGQPISPTVTSTAQKRLSKLPKSPTPRFFAGKQNPLHQQQASEDSNHIMVMHGSALAHAAYYLRAESVKYLLEHEIECSDPIMIDQAIVACHESVAAQVNPSLIQTQNRILQMLNQDWKGEVGARRRMLVAERALNRKRKPIRSNVLLVALAVSSAFGNMSIVNPNVMAGQPSSQQLVGGDVHTTRPAPAMVGPSNMPMSLKSSGSTNSSLGTKGADASSRPPSNKTPFNIGSIPITHLYASNGPTGPELEVIGQQGFASFDASAAPRFDLGAAPISPPSSLTSPTSPTGWFSQREGVPQGPVVVPGGAAAAGAEWHGNEFRPPRFGQHMPSKGILRKIRRNAPAAARW